MTLTILPFEEKDRESLEKLATEFIQSDNAPLYDIAGQLFLARSELKKEKSFDLMKTLENESNRIDTKGYTIKDNNKLVGYAAIRGKIDLTEHSLEPIPPEVRLAFMSPEYQKEAKKELEEFLQSKNSQ